MAEDDRTEFPANIVSAELHTRPAEVIAYSLTNCSDSYRRQGILPVIGKCRQNKGGEYVFKKFYVLV